ncbi:hypothetical protein LINPERHAP1_LOCUS39887 [Linum perenne]
MKGSPSERKLKALRRMRFNGITSIKITSIGNEFMYWILDIYNAERKYFHIGTNQTSILFTVYSTTDALFTVIPQPMLCLLLFHNRCHVLGHYEFM